SASFRRQLKASRRLATRKLATVRFHKDSGCYRSCVVDQCRSSCQLHRWEKAPAPSERLRSQCRSAWCQRLQSLLAQLRGHVDLFLQNERRSLTTRTLSGAGPGKFQQLVNRHHHRGGRQPEPCKHHVVLHKKCDRASEAFGPVPLTPPPSAAFQELRNQKPRALRVARRGHSSRRPCQQYRIRQSRREYH